MVRNPNGSFCYTWEFRDRGVKVWQEDALSFAHFALLKRTYLRSLCSPCIHAYVRTTLAKSVERQQKCICTHKNLSLFVCPIYKSVVLSLGPTKRVNTYTIRSIQTLAIHTQIGFERTQNSRSKDSSKGVHYICNRIHFNTQLLISV